MCRRVCYALPPLLLLLLLCAAHQARGRDLPQYLKACSEKDPNVNECALKNGRAAIPYLVKENLTVSYIINYEPFNKGGTDYMKATVVDSRGEVGHLTINLQNLFNGDKFLGENTNKVLNENWKALVEEVGPAMYESDRAIAQNLVDTLFDGVPYRKVVLE
ncbi:protein takeout-like [Schistocerca piceifrons]|uniref:protein takeout-like n=1 Tax=Schistocerca piceifrons TaxID=274613 RepID=UPI001F5FC507|nr:protein takeout-like [Schistocerca piceifrons]